MGLQANRFTFSASLSPTMYWGMMLSNSEFIEIKWEDASLASRDQWHTVLRRFIFFFFFFKGVLIKSSFSRLSSGWVEELEKSKQRKNHPLTPPNALLCIRKPSLEKVAYICRQVAFLILSSRVREAYHSCPGSSGPGQPFGTERSWGDWVPSSEKSLIPGRLMFYLELMFMPFSC